MVKMTIHDGKSDKINFFKYLNIQFKFTLKLKLIALSD